MQKLLDSDSIHTFLKIEKYILLALEAATEQLNLLSAFLSSPQSLDTTSMKEVIPNYSNQTFQMRLIQHRCAQWYCIKNIDESCKQAIATLELNSLRLEKMSEKIIFLLRYLSKKNESFCVKSNVSYPMINKEIDDTI